jgi:homoserine O-acetyltransferase
LAFLSFSAVAADYPAPKEADWTARDFKFHTGEVCCPSCVCTTPR